MKFKPEVYIKQMRAERRARRLYRMELRLHDQHPEKVYSGTERRRVLIRYED